MTIFLLVWFTLGAVGAALSMWTWWSDFGELRGIGWGWVLCMFLTGAAGLVGGFGYWMAQGSPTRRGPRW